MSSTLIYNADVWLWDAALEGQHFGFVRQNAFMVMKNGFITRISESSEECPSMESFDVIINAHGRLVLPGLIDSHIHIGLFGESRYFVDLSECFSIEALQDKVRKHLDKFPDLPWVTGVNWDQTKLGRFPSSGDLSVITTEKPIFLYRACWHIGVANTTALRLAKIVGVPTEEVLQSPPGGVIEVDAAGNPTGVLKERAVELIVAAQQRLQRGDNSDPSAALQQKMRFLREGMDVCVRAGLTTVQTNDEGALRAYRTLQAQGELPLRIFLTPVHDELHRPVAQGTGIQGEAPFRPDCYGAASADGAHAGAIESRLLMERVKIFSDGSLGAETAALRVFSADGSAPTSRGVFVYERSVLANMIVEAYRAGYRVEIHAIGDAAAEHVLSALDDSEALLREGSIAPVTFCGRSESAQRLRHWRPILTHCQVLGADLVTRMAAKGVVANVQPSFVPTDMQWVRDRISGAQLDYSYAWKTLMYHSSQVGATIRSGLEEQDVLRVAGGSDAPIETPNPFTGIYDAMFRTNKFRIKAGEAESVFQEDQRLSFSEALWIYTVGGAYAAGVEDRLGKIAPGYIGDVVLVDPAILQQPELLRDLVPDAVIVGGNLAAVNRCGPGVHSAPVVERCVQSLSYLKPLEGEGAKAGALSEATFFPGRGGCPGLSVASQESRKETLLCTPTLQFPSGLKCACILTGKYCASC